MTRFHKAPTWLLPMSKAQFTHFGNRYCRGASTFGNIWIHDITCTAYSKLRFQKNPKNKLGNAWYGRGTKYMFQLSNKNFRWEKRKENVCP